MKVLPNGRKIKCCGKCNRREEYENEFGEEEVLCQIEDNKWLVIEDDYIIHPDCPLPDAKGDEE